MRRRQMWVRIASTAVIAPSDTVVLDLALPSPTPPLTILESMIALFRVFLTAVYGHVTSGVPRIRPHWSESTLSIA